MNNPIGLRSRWHSIAERADADSGDETGGVRPGTVWGSTTACAGPGSAPHRTFRTTRTLNSDTHYGSGSGHPGMSGGTAVIAPGFWSLAIPQRAVDRFRTASLPAKETCSRDGRWGRISVRSQRMTQPESTRSRSAAMNSGSTADVRAVSLVFRQAVEGEQRESTIARALGWHEVVVVGAAFAFHQPHPLIGISLKCVHLRGIDRVLDHESCRYRASVSPDTSPGTNQSHDPG